MRLSLVALVAIVCAGLCSAGCGENLASPMAAASPEDATPRQGGTLRLASFADIRGLDPATTSGALDSEAIELIFAGIVDLDAKGEVVPDIASRWEISPDGLEYKFFLREGVRFHDGDELTAEDVKRTMERALHPKTPNPFASFYENIEGFEAYTTKGAPHLDGVRVDGRHVVSIRLAQKDATFLPLFALHTFRPVCKSAGDRYADTWAPCGAGPFKLQPGGWDRGRSLTLVKNPAYFKPGRPYLDAVTFTYLVNIVTQRFKLEAGDLDVVRDFTQADSQRFLTDPRWKPFGRFEPDHSIFGENMNVEMPPFDNVEVRRAVACAIDREHYRLIRATNVNAFGHAIPPGVPGYNGEIPGQAYNLAAALEHMKRAGYPYDPATGKGGWEPHIEYTAYKQGYAEFSAQILQQDLAKIGIRLDIKIVSYASYLSETHRRKKSAISPQGWSQDYPDALDFYESLFVTKSINEEDSNNSSFYSNKAFDDVIDRAHHELDRPARQKLYDQAETMLVSDAPWAFTHSYRWYDVHQPYVRGFESHPVWIFDLSSTWIDRAAGAVARRAGVFGPALAAAPARARAPRREGQPR